MDEKICYYYFVVVFVVKIHIVCIIIIIKNNDKHVLVFLFHPMDPVKSLCMIILLMLDIVNGESSLLL